MQSGCWSPWFGTELIVTDWFSFASIIKCLMPSSLHQQTVEHIHSHSAEVIGVKLTWDTWDSIPLHTRYSSSRCLSLWLCASPQLQGAAAPLCRSIKKKFLCIIISACVEDGRLLNFWPTGSHTMTLLSGLLCGWFLLYGLAGWILPHIQPSSFFLCIVLSLPQPLCFLQVSPPPQIRHHFASVCIFPHSKVPHDVKVWWLGEAQRCPVFHTKCTWRRETWENRLSKT